MNLISLLFELARKGGVKELGRDPGPFRDLRHGGVRRPTPDDQGDDAGDGNEIWQCVYLLGKPLNLTLRGREARGTGQWVAAVGEKGRCFGEVSVGADGQRKYAGQYSSASSMVQWSPSSMT